MQGRHQGQTSWLRWKISNLWNQQLKWQSSQAFVVALLLRPEKVAVSRLYLTAEMLLEFAVVKVELVAEEEVFVKKKSS